MKPIVTYTDVVVPPEVNSVAIIAGIEGHPSQMVSGGDVCARTSRVVRVGKDGEFETENTIYRRSA